MCHQCRGTACHAQQGHTGTTRSCQHCRNRSTKQGALPALQGCGADTHPVLQGCGADTHPALRGHGTLKGYRADTHLSWKEHGTLKGYRADTHPGTQGTAGMQGCHPCRDGGPWLAARMQGCHAPSTAGTRGTASTQLPPIHHCLHRRNSSSHHFGTQDIAGMQDCHPSSTAGTRGTPGVLPVRHCRAAGHCRATGRCGHAGLPPLQRCRAVGHCCGRDRAALPLLHCQHSGTASLALRGTEAPPTRHCRDAGALSIIPPALPMECCHPRCPWQSEGHRVPAQAVLQCRNPPGSPRQCPAPAHCNGSTASPSLHSH